MLDIEDKIKLYIKRLLERSDYMNESTQVLMEIYCAQSGGTEMSNHDNGHDNSGDWGPAHSDAHDNNPNG